MSSQSEKILKRLENFVDPLTGIIKQVYQIENSPQDPRLFNFATEVAQSARFSGLPNFQRNGGAGLTLENAKLSAIGESLERYCSSIYRKEDFVYGSYSEFRTPALNPESARIFTPQQYQNHDFSFRELNEKDKIYWVRGFSMLSQQPTWIPAGMVYVPYFFEGGEKAFSFSTSSGMAFGASLGTALLSGLYELIERDAVMLMWLKQLSLPQISLDELPGATAEVLDRNFKDLKDALRVVDITTDLGIPVFFSAFLGHEPRVAVGAAGNLDPEKAFLKSVIEASQTRIWARFLLRQYRGHRFKADFSDLKSFDHHVFLYAQPEMFPHFEFVLQSREKVKLRSNMARELSAFAELQLILGQIGTKVSDVFYVEITAPEIAEAGFFAVKVIIPDLIPLCVGVRELPLGLKRLRQGPNRQINPAPHPFP